MKKVIIYILSLIVLLSSCAFQKNNEVSSFNAREIYSNFIDSQVLVNQANSTEKEFGVLYKTTIKGANDKLLELILYQDNGAVYLISNLITIPILIKDYINNEGGEIVIKWIDYRTIYIVGNGISKVFDLSVLVDELNMNSFIIKPTYPDFSKVKCITAFDSYNKLIKEIPDEDTQKIINFFKLNESEPLCINASKVDFIDQIILIMRLDNENYIVKIASDDSGKIYINNAFYNFGDITQIMEILKKNGIESYLN